MRRILVIILFLLVQQASGQLSSSVTSIQKRDVFPLGLHKSWTYTFQSYYQVCQNLLYGCSGSSDTGSISYLVTDSTTFADSIYWAVKVSRSLYHHDYNQLTAFDTIYRIRDSSAFYLTELLSGNHQLIADTIDYIQNPIWPFMRQHCTDTKVYRYQNVDTNGFAFLSICVPNARSLYSLSFDADSGLTFISQGFASILTHIIESAKLSNSVLTSVSQSSAKVHVDPVYTAVVFPNPFNSSTIISFKTPVSDRITLCIFNTLGQKVLTLVDRYFISGEHSILWNAGNLSSGIYFIQVKAGNHYESVKCLLMK